MNRLRLILLAVAWLPLVAWPVDQYEVRVLEKKPQSRKIFVQGLEFAGDHLYVSTGIYGRSHLLRYNVEDDTLEASRKLDPRAFAEGLTVFGDRVYQLTWRNRAMLVYSREDLQLLNSLPLPGEGWGLANNGELLIYSDGSDQLHFMSPETGKILRSIAVTEDGRPVSQLNELEWIDGMVWANVWRSDRIVIIDPATGAVVASINLQGLLPAHEYRSGTDVLNGIARNPADGAIWVTGKRWPWRYRIELTPVGETQQVE